MKRMQVSVAIVGVALAMATAWQVRATGAKRAPAPHAAAARAADECVVAEGRLVAYPGAEVTVGTDVAGTLVRMCVAENQQVRAGDVIAEIKADDLRAALAEAEANAEKARADLRLADIEAARSEKLVAADLDARQALDRAVHARDAARAATEQADAEIARLRAQLAKTRIVAPIGGTVVQRLVDAGESIAAGAPLVRIADLHRTRIEAEVDEFDVGRMRLGAGAVITAEGFDGRQWRGRIEEVPGLVVTRQLAPNDPGRPTDTRVLLVKIALDEPAPLKLGQRVEVSIARGGASS